MTDVSPAPLRLLMVSSDTFPPTRVDVSVLFGEELASRGHRTDLILQSEAACDRSYAVAWDGGTVWVGPTDLGSSLIHRLRKHARGIAADMRLFSHMRRGNHDVVIVKDKFLSGVMALVAAVLYRKPFVFWLSYPFPEEYLERISDGTARYPFLYWIRGHTFRVLLYRLLLPRAHRVFVQSDQMKRNVEAQGIAGSKMTPVPMGIQPRMFVLHGDSGVRRVLPAGIPCIVYIGALDRTRRLEFLFQMLARVLVVRPDARLYLVGKGVEVSDEEFLVAEAERLGVRSSVVFTGQLPRDAALGYVAEADVCVSPIRPTRVLNAASPTKLIEYMAVGKAVVANDHPDQRSVIEASGGGLCVPYEEAAFAEATLQLLSHPDQAREMGRRGREWVLEHRAYGAIARTVEQALQRAIATSRLGHRQ